MLPAACRKCSSEGTILGHVWRSCPEPCGGNGPLPTQPDQVHRLTCTRACVHTHSAQPEVSFGHVACQRPIQQGLSRTTGSLLSSCYVLSSALGCINRVYERRQQHGPRLERVPRRVGEPQTGNSGQEDKGPPHRARTVAFPSLALPFLF